MWNYDIRSQKIDMFVHMAPPQQLLPGEHEHSRADGVLTLYAGQGRRGSVDWLAVREGGGCRRARRGGVPAGEACQGRRPLLAPVGCQGSESSRGAGRVMHIPRGPGWDFLEPLVATVRPSRFTPSLLLIWPQPVTPRDLFVRQSSTPAAGLCTAVGWRLSPVNCNATRLLSGLSVPTHTRRERTRSAY